MSAEVKSAQAHHEDLHDHQKFIRAGGTLVPLKEVSPAFLEQEQANEGVARSEERVSRRVPEFARADTAYGRIGHADCRVVELRTRVSQHCLQERDPVQAAYEANRDEEELVPEVNGEEKEVEQEVGFAIADV